MLEDSEIGYFQEVGLVDGKENNKTEYTVIFQ